MNSSKYRSIVLNIIIVILGIVLAIVSFRMLYEIADYDLTNTYDEYQLSSRLEYSKESLLRNVYNNQILGVKETKKLSELYAVAEYYDAAVMYHAYETAGYTEEAENCAKRMESEREKTGEYEFELDTIDRMLGIGIEED